MIPSTDKLRSKLVLLGSAVAMGAFLAGCSDDSTESVDVSQPLTKGGAKVAAKMTNDGSPLVSADLQKLIAYLPNTVTGIGWIDYTTNAAKEKIFTTTATNGLDQMIAATPADSETGQIIAALKAANFPMLDGSKHGSEVIKRAAGGINLANNFKSAQDISSAGGIALVVEAIDHKQMVSKLIASKNELTKKNLDSMELANLGSSDNEGFKITPKNCTGDGCDIEVHVTWNNQYVFAKAGTVELNKTPASELPRIFNEDEYKKFASNWLGGNQTYTVGFLNTEILGSPGEVPTFVALAMGFQGQATARADVFSPHQR